MRRSMDVDTQVCVSVTLALATLFTIARFWARSITKVKLWVDDWFGLAAYVSLKFCTRLISQAHFYFLDDGRNILSTHYRL
jgi:hypothetical protein